MLFSLDGVAVQLHKHFEELLFCEVLICAYILNRKESGSRNIAKGNPKI